MLVNCECEIYLCRECSGPGIDWADPGAFGPAGPFPTPMPLGIPEEHIRREIKKIKPDTLKKVSETVLTRLQKGTL